MVEITKGDAQALPGEAALLQGSVVEPLRRCELSVQGLGLKAGWIDSELVSFSHLLATPFLPALDVAANGCVRDMPDAALSANMSETPGPL